MVIGPVNTQQDVKNVLKNYYVCPSHSRLALFYYVHVFCGSITGFRIQDFPDWWGVGGGGLAVYYFG